MNVRPLHSTPRAIYPKASWPETLSFSQRRSDHSLRTLRWRHQESKHRSLDRLCCTFLIMEAKRKLKISQTNPVLVFDTSALIDLVSPGNVRHCDYVNKIQQRATWLYHPLSLAELADYCHEAVWRARRRCSPAEVRSGIRLRRLLISALFTHRKRDDPATYIAGGRLLPFSTSFESFSFIAHQRMSTHLVRVLPKSRQTTVVAPMTDHQILAAACWLRRTRFDVTFLSGDKDLIAAADRLCIPRVYSKDPSQVSPFPFCADEP